MSVQTASITPAEAVAAQAAKGQAAPVDGAVAIRPEYIPEKFWKDGKVDSEGLAKSYTELEKAKATPPPRSAASGCSSLRSWGGASPDRCLL